ncbi:hypothetical protein AQUCO_01400784v1, partial [Aquilegia coerulea]
ATCCKTRMFRQRLQSVVKDVFQKKPINKIVTEARLLAQYCQERIALNQSKKVCSRYASEFEKNLQENKDKIPVEAAEELEDAIASLKTVVDESDEKFGIAIRRLRRKVVDEKDKDKLFHLLLDTNSKVQKYT